MRAVLNVPLEPALPEGWVKTPKFASQGKVYKDSSGKEYKIIYKHEHDYSRGARFLRGCLGSALTVGTLGIALAFKGVRNLFTKEKESIHYAIPLEEIRMHTQDSRIPLQIKLEYISQYLPYFKLQEPGIIRDIVTKSVAEGGNEVQNLSLIAKTKGSIEYSDETVAKAVDSFIEKGTYKEFSKELLQPFTSVIENRLAHYNKEKSIRIAYALLPSHKAAEYLVSYANKIPASTFFQISHIALQHPDKCSKETLRQSAKVYLAESYPHRNRNMDTQDLGYLFSYVCKHPEEFSPDDKLCALGFMPNSQLLDALFDQEANNSLRLRVIADVYTRLPPRVRERVDALLLSQLNQREFTLDVLSVCKAIGAKESPNLLKAAKDMVIALARENSRYATMDHFDHIIAPSFASLGPDDQKFVIAHFSKIEVSPELAKIVLERHTEFASDLFEKALRLAMKVRMEIPKKALEHALDTSKDVEIIKYVFKNARRFDVSILTKAEAAFFANEAIALEEKGYVDTELLRYLEENVKNSEALFERYKPHINEKNQYKFIRLFEKVLESTNSLDTVCFIANLQDVHDPLNEPAAKRLLHLLKVDTALTPYRKKIVYKLANYIFDNERSFTPEELKKAALLFLERDDEGDKLEAVVVGMIQATLEKVVRYLEFLGIKIKLSEKAELKYKTVFKSIGVRKQATARVRVIN